MTVDEGAARTMTASINGASETAAMVAAGHLGKAADLVRT